MRIQIISLFPEMFKGYFSSSMMLKARKNNNVTIEVINLRDFGIGKRKTVDDIPYGGGDGMILMADPIIRAIELARQKARHKKQKVILMTPRGKKFKQATAKRLADVGDDLIIVCGRYEGYDERITEVVDKQISIGDYILTGGELPAMIVADSVVRLLPGVLGGETSAEIESFSDGKTIEYPQYTRPEEYKGMKVPKVLLSGNHAEIARWRQEHSRPAN